MTGRLFPWRAAPPSDWLDQFRAVQETVLAFEPGSDGKALALRLRGLANRQLDTGRLMKVARLVQQLLPHARQLGLRRFRIGLIGNRTLSYLAGALGAAGLARGLLLDAVEAPYDSASAFAYGHGDLFNGEPVDAVVALLDEAGLTSPGDLLRFDQERDAVAASEALLTRMAQTARRNMGVPFIVATIPQREPPISSSDLVMAGTTARLVFRLNDMIVTDAVEDRWTVWDLAGLAGYVGYETWFDPVRFFEAKVPFSIEISPLVADHLASLIAAVCSLGCRVLVLDLDNTIWGGVIGDDGLAGLRLGSNSAEGEAYQSFQRFALELRCRGVVLAVCSKNDKDKAIEPFRSHPEMLLRESDIAVFQANWNNKADNLIAIADQLNLGVDALCLADDNPSERAWVRKALPQVTVPEIGDDPAHFASLIARSGAFHHVVLNEDDLNRAARYQSPAGSQARQVHAEDYDSYLQSLDMKMEIRRFDEVGRARIAQLVNKSNQFNLTTRRYNEQAIYTFEEDQDVLCWQVRLSDCLDDHGMIAVVIVRMAGKAWVIDTWLMSCRVLMRGVEAALMNALMQCARETGVEEVIGEFIPTQRNTMVKDFYRNMGFLPSGQNGEAVRFVACPAIWQPLPTKVRAQTLAHGAYRT